MPCILENNTLLAYTLEINITTVAHLLPFSLGWNSFGDSSFPFCRGSSSVSTWHVRHSSRQFPTAANPPAALVPSYKRLRQILVNNPGPIQQILAAQLVHIPHSLLNTLRSSSRTIFFCNAHHFSILLAIAELQPGSFPPGLKVPCKE